MIDNDVDGDGNDDDDDAVDKEKQKVLDVGLYDVCVMGPSDREICEETPTILQNLTKKNTAMKVLEKKKNLV